MYQRSPNGLVWLADTQIATAKDLVGKRLGLTTGDEIRVNAIFKINGLEPDYETVQMSFDPQPLIDGDADAITCYVTNQPIQLQLKGIANKSLPNSDFGLKAYGDVLFASKKYVDGQPRPARRTTSPGCSPASRPTSPIPKAVLPLLTDDVRQGRRHRPRLQRGRQPGVHRPARLRLHRRPTVG